MDGQTDSWLDGQTTGQMDEQEVRVQKDRSDAWTEGQDEGQDKGQASEFHVEGTWNGSKRSLRCDIGLDIMEGNRWKRTWRRLSQNRKRIVMSEVSDVSEEC